MDSADLLPQLDAMRRFFESGTTRDYQFRKTQLLQLRQALLHNQDALMQSLYADLKKSPEEAWATELGLVLADVNYAIKHLHTWMRPQRVATNLVNLPSTSRIYCDPLGVVLIVAPWNYPLQLCLNPLIGAIAGGNCAVIKPSELAPAAATILEKIIVENFSSDYIRVIQGDGAAVIPAMMDAFRFDHVLYTGSVAVGKIIYQLAAKQLVPVTLELGGKSPAIVYADANIAAAARRIVVGKFVNAGQTCIAPDYVLVHETVKQQLIEKMKAAILAFYGTNPSDSYDYGRIINEQRFNKLIGYLAEGTIITGGEHRVEDLFIAPTLLEDVSAETGLMQEEIFGPLLPIVSFTDDAQAMMMVAQHPNPLALYLFTESASTQKKWMESVAFGGGCINNTDWQFTNHHLPFGGVGNSGIGAYHGKFSFDTFTRKKPVLKTPAWFDPLLKYPPFRGKLKLFKWLIR